MTDKTATAVTIENIAVDDLRPDPANPRKISEAELEALTNGERITPVLVEDGKVTIGYHGIGCSFYD